ncbi:MAG: hypothetical protein JWP31_242 [Aeromicrobium sp.]|nr:hypothetical protein [Aeromicrobium sp.]
MQQIEHSRHTTSLPRPSRRAVVLGLALLAILHSFLIMLWVMPVNPIRDAVGNERLSNYINPYFEQSWSVFAPTPRRGGENVVVRAYIGDVKKGDGTLTDWFDITSNEDARIKYLVNPSRIHSATRRLGGNVNNALAAFSAAERKVVGANYVESSRKDMTALLLKVNPRGSAGLADIDAYVRNDEMLTRYLTMYATARWGDGVTMIQYRVGHRSVPNYSIRKDVKFTDVPFEYYTFGYRKAMPGSADAQKAFDDYVDEAPPKAATKGKAP